jgi:hypothetical protein
LLAAPCTVRCEDHFLTIGGGDAPASNQVSLEKNVLLFQRLLGERYPRGARHQVFFSDGEDAGRDLQFQDPEFPIPQEHLYLAELLGDLAGIDLQYRSHQIAGASAATREHVEAWFRHAGTRLSEGDRLFIYVTGHGGEAASKDRPHDTDLRLWDEGSLRMSEFATLLDHVPARVPVVLVMVQCYSGGFAHSLFKAGDRDQGLSSANRCGFFATVHDRPAAGCTPDIDEEDYREYSTYFFEALRGKSRTGEPVERPDYDGDGRTSLAEAHARVVLTSTTIDVPVRTSDAFLRVYSQSPRNRRPGGARPVRPPQTAGAATLLSADTPYEQLIRHADAIDRAVIDGLSAELRLTGPTRGQAARAKAREIQGKMRGIDERIADVQQEYDQARDAIKAAVLKRWPELSNPWHPSTARILKADADDLIDLIESHASYERFDKSGVELGDLDAAKLDYERDWAKHQRLIRALQGVALAANLPHVATPDLVERFQKLRAAEGAWLHESAK